MSYEPSPQLVEILESLVEGALAVEQREQLASILSEDEAAKRFFVDYMWLHATAQWNAVELFGLDREEEHVSRQSSATSPCFPPDEDLGLGPPRRFSWTAWGLAGVGATCALVVAVIFAGWMNPPVPPLPPVAMRLPGNIAAATPAKNAFAGLLTDEENAQWGPESVACRRGELLSTGDFHLLSGQISIDLFGGGVISATGPAKFSVRNSESVAIGSGNVVVTILDDHSRLTVETPVAELLHAGTEFAVSVWPDGTSDVAVLSGAVEVHPRLRNTAYASAQLVGAGNAFRISPDGRYGTLPDDFEFPNPNLQREQRSAATPPPMPAITAEGFTVRYVKADPNANIALLELGLADRLLEGRLPASEDVTIDGVAAVDFEERGHTKDSENVFQLDLPFPGDEGGQVDLDDSFAIRVTGTMVVHSPWVYSFLTNSDDGVRLKIDDEVVIVDDGFHPPTISIGSIPLDRGEHSVELTYYDLHRGARIELGAAAGRVRDVSQFSPLSSTDVQ